MWRFLLTPHGHRLLTARVRSVGGWLASPARVNRSIFAQLAFLLAGEWSSHHYFQQRHAKSHARRFVRMHAPARPAEAYVHRYTWHEDNSRAPQQRERRPFHNFTAHRTYFTTMTANSSLLQIAFYAVLFAVTLATISATLAKYPLFPLQTDSLDWSNNWLFATVIDYYGACLCFCGVILGTEENWIKGILWVLGCCLLGSPVW